MSKLEFLKSNAVVKIKQDNYFPFVLVTDYTSNPHFKYVIFLVKSCCHLISARAIMETEIKIVYTK